MFHDNSLFLYKEDFTSFVASQNLNFYFEFQTCVECVDGDERVIWRAGWAGSLVKGGWAGWRVWKGTKVGGQQGPAERWRGCPGGSVDRWVDRRGMWEGREMAIKAA